MTKKIQIKHRNKAKDILKNFSKTLSEVQLNAAFYDTINLFLDCKGKIITTGMGKAGIAMRKFSSTLCSLGFPSCYIHPGEASHGDLGILSTNDILFVASTSGKTREVIEIIDLAKNNNIDKIIGITSHKESLMREKLDFVIDMGKIDEAGYLDIVPTSSVLVMLAITDCLALLSAEIKGFTKENYGLLHHSGYIGEMIRKN